MFLALYLPSALAHFKSGIDKFLILSETFSEEKPPKYFFICITLEKFDNEEEEKIMNLSEPFYINTSHSFGGKVINLVIKKTFGETSSDSN